MKTLSILIFSLIFSQLFSQEVMEKEIKSDVNEVTVFLDGAQVIRNKTINLTKGKTIVKFVNLSPFIDAKSIQVKAIGDLTVLSVNHQQNFLDKMEKSAQLMNLEKQLETIEDKIKLETTLLKIIDDQLGFLEANKDIGGKNEQVNISNLQQTSEFYGKQLTSLKMKEIERTKTLKTFMNQKDDLQKQLNTLSAKKEYPTGEVLVKVDAQQANRFSLELSYMVENAGWFPSYDIRAKNIDEPVQIIYKANVRQDTKVNWDNVKLTFSSADPNESGLAPELKTYYLNYNTQPPTYKLTSNSVRGQVMDQQGEPVVGAYVMVDGTTIGTVTNAQGSYSITVPNNSTKLSFSFIGFITQTRRVSGEVMNVAMKEDKVTLNEIAVVGNGNRTMSSSALQGRVAGISIERSKYKVRGSKSLAVPFAQVENQTSIDFEIKTPYTISSDNKNYTVDMALYDLPAFYQYYCVPKVDKNAFLIANIVNWEKYNLLEGEANLFFEDTYVGKTILDVRYATDTLEISLGRDKKVAVQRDKVKNYIDKRFIGSNKEATLAWKTTVKNNKSQEINMIVLDQVPVSTTEEIEVNVQNVSGAKHNLENGEIKWEFKLKPSDKKELDLKYAVKYPKNRNLILE